MRSLPTTLVLTFWFWCLWAPPADAVMIASREGQQVTIQGDHFRLTIDAGRGGQISDIELYDGSLWNRLLGADDQTFPDLVFDGPQTRFPLDQAADARFEKFEATPEVVRVRTAASPRSAEGAMSPWTVRIEYEVFAEGAIFATTRLILPEGAESAATAQISLRPDRAVVEAAKYRQQTFTSEAMSGAFQGRGLPTARIAFGVSPERSFTNEVQVIVEDKKGVAGEASLHAGQGCFTWRLGAEPKDLRGPAEYSNRFALGLGAAAVGKPRTNVIGQRVYHWINWINKEEVHGAAWYPTDTLIDAMVDQGATMLILHEHWMDEEGNNGRPHANYQPRDEQAMTHMIGYAHRRGLRVGVYCRGIERYLLDTGFFPKYLKRDWDGLYVDWSGAYDIAHHENTNPPDSILGDAHQSANGLYAPAREWFLYTKKLRDLVGPNGFLIAHQGFGSTGILANLAVDAYLPGESPLDHQMFQSRDDAVYQGMLGGVACMPWTVDSPDYITPEGIAKMAVWGFYPHIGLAFSRPKAKRLFPADPTEPPNTCVAPYWRVLAAIDASRCAVYNSPAINRVAATSSDPNIPCLIYKQMGDSPDDAVCLAIVANLGHEPASATITLVPDVLGINGRYRLGRVDSATGAIHPAGEVSDTLRTSQLSPWQIEGLRLTRLEGKEP